MYSCMPVDAKRSMKRNVNSFDNNTLHAESALKTAMSSKEPDIYSFQEIEKV